MKFTKEIIWNECETNRKLGKLSAAKLSKLLFPQYPNTIYATRRNLLDGGMIIPISVLLYFGLKKIVFSKLNVPTGTSVEAVVECEKREVTDITNQLVNVVNVLAYNTPTTKLPQTIRKAIKLEKATSHLSLTTFEKAFEAIGNVTMYLEYKELDMGGMF